MSRILPSNDVNVLHDEVGFNTIFISGLKIDRLKYCACSFKNLFTENTVQEPTFERIIVVYRYSFQLLGAQYTLKYEYLWGRRTFLIHIIYCKRCHRGTLYMDSFFLQFIPLLSRRLFQVQYHIHVNQIMMTLKLSAEQESLQTSSYPWSVGRPGHPYSSLPENTHGRHGTCPCKSYNGDFLVQLFHWLLYLNVWLFPL